MKNANDQLLIQRFIQETLTGAELKEFQERMTGDADFRKEVEFYYLLFSGIRLAREQELQNYITSNVSVKHYTPRSVIAIVIVMLIIIASGIGVWNYLEQDAMSRNRRFFHFSFFNKIKDKPAPVTAEKPKTEKKTAPKPMVVPPDNNDAPQDSAALYMPAQQDDSLMADENIVIRKDELLVTARLPVEHKNADTEGKGASLAGEAAGKLNPGAQLPDEDRMPATTLQVEFWRSPVNYKGFKLLKNKLVLFGIERPDAVKLYLVNDQLYMQYGSTISKLTPTYDYQPFFALKESEIPAQLK